MFKTLPIIKASAFQNVRTKWIIRILIVVVLNLFFVPMGSFTFYTGITTYHSVPLDYCVLIVASLITSILLWLTEKSNTFNHRVFSPTAILLTVPTLMIMLPSTIFSIESNQLSGVADFLTYKNIISLFVLAKILWLALLLQVLAFLLNKKWILALSYHVITSVYVLHWIYILSWNYPK